MSVDEIIDLGEHFKSDLYESDFLLTWDKSIEEIKRVLHVAQALRYFHCHHISPRCFTSGLAISIFKDQSTRTRFSFASAANLLGLGLQDLDEQKTQVTHGETVRETANMISFLTEVIGIRDDIFLGEGHAYMTAVADALDEGFAEGVLNQRPAVINLQCDIDHPTQSMADLMHLKNYFGGLGNLAGKKIAMSWAYSPSYGKPLSVPQGIVGLMTRFGMDVVLAHPPGYHLIPDVIDVAKKNAEASGGRFEIVQSMDEAFETADIVYPKSWAPYTVMEERTRLLKSGDQERLVTLEEECLQQNAQYVDWECNENNMKRTRNREALYMHCLPADISGVSCEHGEVENRIFDKYRLDTYREAGYKPFVIAAIMINTRFKDPVGLLKKMAARNVPISGF